MNPREWYDNYNNAYADGRLSSLQMDAFDVAYFRAAGLGLQPGSVEFCKEVQRLYMTVA